jgi:S1-C subfamily serine protease
MVGAMIRTFLLGAILAQLVVAPLHALGGAASFDATDTLGDRVVMVLGSRGNSCSGAPIRPDVILTAAHCVRGAKEIAIAYFENGSPVLQQTRRAVIHPNASTNFRRTVDAAIVFLDQPLPERFLINALDDRQRAREPGEPAVIAGFGLQRSSNLKSGGTLRAAEVTLLRPRSRRIVRLGIPDAGALSVCKGDSGGPLFDEELRIIGIVFATEVDKQPALCGEVGQAIRVAPIRDWIDATLSKEPPRRPPG